MVWSEVRCCDVFNWCVGWIGGGGCCGAGWLLWCGVGWSDVSDICNPPNALPSFNLDGMGLGEVMGGVVVGGDWNDDTTHFHTTPR